MSKILIFSGTGDGRLLAEKLADAGYDVTVSVATEYGEQVMPQNSGIKVHCGRMDEAHMYAFMSSCGVDFVIDATHPYAKVVSEIIRKVCEKEKYKYYRLVRNSYENELSDDSIVIADNTNEAADFAQKMSGNIFLSTGSKELSVFFEKISDKNRIYARILPSVKVLEQVTKAGMQGKQIICMQGPFSEELNYAMFAQTNSRILVTKESGSTGGFIEKIKAAKRLGMKVIVIKRPVEQGYSLEQLLNKFDVRAKIHSQDENNADKNYDRSVQADKKNISLVGIGMGSQNGLTKHAYDLCENAQLIIGANRMLEALKFNKNARVVSSYKPDKIADEICGTTEKNIVVALSGDVGFYSGAKKLLDELEKRNCSVSEIVPGISTVVYMAAKAGISWDDMAFVSLHGRNQNVVEAVRHNQKVFVLVGGSGGVSQLCNILCENNYSKVEVLVGSNLSYEDEKFVSGSAADFCDYSEDGVSAVIVLNSFAYAKKTTHGIADAEFIRDKVPMTKEEIREVSLAKLGLTKDSIVYDIGAGTGSVSIECAISAFDGKVYAIEKKDEAVKLIERNCIKFGITNIETIKASAPDIDEKIQKEMPAPTHAFIGGSSGNMSQILDWLVEKSSGIRVVINAIALETISEIMNELKKRNIQDAEIVCMNVSKSKKLGAYNMMMANNPVYIVSFDLK